MRRVRELKEKSSSKINKWIVVGSYKKGGAIYSTFKTKKEMKSFISSKNKGWEFDVFKASYNFTETWRT